MPKAVLNSRSRRNHRGLSNSRNQLAQRDVYHRSLRFEPLEGRHLLSAGRASTANVWRSGYDPDIAESDLLYTEAKVETGVDGTYYCAISHAGGGTYMGLQSASVWSQKHVHFSVWDADDGSAATVLWQDPEVTAVRFGGEGTGWAMSLPYAWQDNVAYSMSIHLTHLDASTLYDAYFFDPKSTDGWRHLATVSRPVADAAFPNFDSFIEDFVETPSSYRSYLVGNSWLHKPDGTWMNLKTGLYTWNGDYTTVDADVVAPYWWRLETGGSTVPDTPNLSILVAGSGTQPSGNRPTLTSIATLTSAIENQDFTITYDTLAAAADEFDVDFDPIAFRIESMLSGTLTLNGQPVAPGTTLLEPGQSLVWHPQKDVNGVLIAFTVVASDDDGDSNSPVLVQVDVAAMNDQTLPTVTISKAAGQADSASVSPINFTVVFSESVSDFATGDVSFTESTAPGTLVGAVSGSGTTYNVAVSGMTGSGTVIASIAAAKAHDAAGNPNAASTSTDNSVTYNTIVSAPSSLTASAASSAQINLAWADNSGNEDGFKIERMIKDFNGIGIWVPIAKVSANTTSYQNIGLSASTTYYYRVRAYNTAGDSGYTNEADATTLDSAPTWSTFQGDLNGDGIQDILRQNQTTGVVEVGINSATVGGTNWSVLGQADPTLWQVRATGDFNGDGTSDVLWQGISGDTTGVVGAWVIHSNAITGWAGLGGANPAEWMIAGTGNFSVSGRRTTDILWQAVSGANLGLVGAYKISNNAVVDWVGFSSAPPSVWKITGTKDVNGDGINDVNWRTPITGVPTTQGSYIIKNYAVTAWQAGAPLNAVNEVVPASDVASLAQSDLQLIVHEAIARWARTGLDAASIAKLGQIEFAIDDLNGSLLGTADANRVTIDSNAAGHGWFVDQTPTLDEEYSVSSDARLKAIDPRAVDRIDLLSVVEHELGHVLGLADLDALADNLMSGVLESGVRKTPCQRHADAAFASG